VKNSRLIEGGAEHAAIEAVIDSAIRNLPLSKHHMNADFAVRKTRRQILSARSTIAAIADKRFQPSTKKAAIEELQQTSKTARAAAAAIDAMRAPALRFVERQHPGADLASLAQALHILANLSDCATLGDDDGPFIQKTGRPTLQNARFIAASASAAFEYYTGRRATITNRPGDSKRRGEFVGFLEAIFKAFDIQADAGSFAQDAAKTRKSLGVPATKAV
jgi:hypothetical protein